MIITHGRRPGPDWGSPWVLAEQLEEEQGQLVRSIQLTAYRNLAGCPFTPS